MIDPSVVTTHFIPVDVETGGELSVGRTVCDFRFRSRRPANVQFAMDADEPKFVRDADGDPGPYRVGSRPRRPAAAGAGTTPRAVAGCHRTARSIGSNGRSTRFRRGADSGAAGWGARQEASWRPRISIPPEPRPGPRALHPSGLSRQAGARIAIHRNPGSRPPRRKTWSSSPRAASSGSPIDRHPWPRFPRAHWRIFALSSATSAWSSCSSSRARRARLARHEQTGC